MNNLYKTLFGIFDTYVNSMGNVAASIIGIGALFLLASKTFKSIINNEPIDIYPFFKPFIITILCLNFTIAVIIPLQYVLSPIKNYALYIKNDTEKNNLASIAAYKSTLKKQQDQRAKDAASQNTGGISLFSDLSLSKMSDSINEWCLGGVIKVMSFLRSILELMYNFLRIFFLAVLGVIGPIAFAISVFPGFEGNINNWLAKYISIYMWAPILYLLEVFQNVAETHFTNSLTATSSNLGLTFGLIAFDFMAVVMVTQIPLISSWIIQGGETAQGMLAPAAIVGGLAGAAGGAVVGRSKK